ncbi:tigger transposable element-derived protein 4-like [Rhizophagus clarus]|uniref:Tigger transposable element-derived protein 4-like n=1 Tax=Rhizophagus clarus TaxID=94130 RepID=A0A8H3QEN1_9GLOM|nr:tigger transposable element-derived protein 4-like [Rhizophagus clarus]
MSTRKRTILSAAQKREICEIKEREPNLSNTNKESVKKFCGPKWPQLEKVLGLWVDNALNTKQDIDGNILKTKAAFFAKKFFIEDFHQSEGEVSSAPSAESIENDRLALQQFLRSYNPEDIWNGDETGLFWKMELSRVLARDPISGHKKEKSRVTIFCATNATGTEKMALTFIHKHKTSRAMKNLNYKNLSVYYYWNKKAWMQVDGLVEVLADYNIFKALQNSAEAYFKEEEEAELERLIALLSEGDHFDAREYINIEDEMAAEGALTDDEIIDAVLNADKEEEMVINDDEFIPILEKVSLKETEKSVDNMIRFLYEQGPEFGKVNDELKILKGLHKRVKLHLVKNLKQLNLHNFYDYIADNNVV